MLPDVGSQILITCAKPNLRGIPFDQRDGERSPDPHHPSRSVFIRVPSQGILTRDSSCISQRLVRQHIAPSRAMISMSQRIVGRVGRSKRMSDVRRRLSWSLSRVRRSARRSGAWRRPLRCSERLTIGRQSSAERFA